jgi:hypothetical protein
MAWYYITNTEIISVLFLFDCFEAILVWFVWCLYSVCCWWSCPLAVIVASKPKKYTGTISVWSRREHFFELLVIVSCFSLSVREYKILECLYVYMFIFRVLIQKVLCDLHITCMWELLEADGIQLFLSMKWLQ